MGCWRRNDTRTGRGLELLVECVLLSHQGVRAALLERHSPSARGDGDPTFRDVTLLGLGRSSAGAAPHPSVQPPGGRKGPKHSRTKLGQEGLRRGLVAAAMLREKEQGLSPH